MVNFISTSKQGEGVKSTPRAHQYITLIYTIKNTTTISTLSQKTGKFKGPV